MRVFRFVFVVCVERLRYELTRWHWWWTGKNCEFVCSFDVRLFGWLELHSMNDGFEQVLNGHVARRLCASNVFEKNRKAPWRSHPNNTSIEKAIENISLCSPPPPIFPTTRLHSPTYLKPTTPANWSDAQHLTMSCWCKEMKWWCSIAQPDKKMDQLWSQVNGFETLETKSLVIATRPQYGG